MTSVTGSTTAPSTTAGVAGLSNANDMPSWTLVGLATMTLMLRPWRLPAIGVPPRAS